MNKDLSFKQIADKYVSFVVRKYRCPTVIFDGYRVSSTKDHEHAKRCPIPLSRPVHITDEVRVPYTQEKYFILEENKANFVQFLSARLRTAGVDVIECDGDADCYIAKTALEYASRNEGPIAAVLDDTDIAVMLLYHWEERMDDVIAVQEVARRSWSVEKDQAHIASVKEHLLFIYAWSGYDTTSSIHNKGKIRVVKTFRKCSGFRAVGTIMSDANSNQNVVGEASAKAFKHLYGVSEKKRHFLLPSKLNSCLT